MTTTTDVIEHRRAHHPWLHFIRHFAEMVIAMGIGMLVFGAAVSALFGELDILQHPDVSALVMATNMTLGMSLWMAYRKHSWPSILEMGAAMYLPFIVLLVPYWAGQLSGA
jgi:flagellar biosynthetic protein FliP